ncbi:acylphosphatase [Melioribacter sp. OK-6-Me]|uniref:acylphosphatase n=1 Tax=unclassified Melioribacter TaxID=2627329 RepID=UPI003ED9F299
MKRAEIIVKGLVQGVGFRYFVLRHAQKLGLKGYVKNLYTGEVLTVVEGEEYKIEELFNSLKIGPPMSDVKSAAIKWLEPNNEFTKFEIRY